MFIKSLIYINGTPVAQLGAGVDIMTREVKSTACSCSLGCASCLPELRPMLAGRFAQTVVCPTQGKP
jgi:hypothetical protein